MSEINFHELIGQKVFIYTKLTELEEQRKGGRTAIAIIRGVESGGIWIEHEGMTKDMSKQFGVRLTDLSRADAVIFLPFSSILFAAYLSPKLDEESFGLRDNE